MASVSAVEASLRVSLSRPDPKDVKQNSAMVDSAINALKRWDRALKALVINPDRALEELNSDWTASQELADVLMRKYKVPFRVGHHFASDVVEYARAHDIKPLDFPYDQSKRIYEDVVKDTKYPPELPMSEDEFRATLNPIAIVKNRATIGGPQPAEMARMLKEARQRLAAQDAWIKAHRAHINDSLADLDKRFDALVASAGDVKTQ